MTETGISGIMLLRKRAELLRDHFDELNRTDIRSELPLPSASCLFMLSAFKVERFMRGHQLWGWGGVGGTVNKSTEGC